MVDVYLIVLAIVVPFILLFLNVMLLRKFIDPEHAKGHLAAKAVIVFGLLMSECTVMLLPLDVGNRAGLTGCGFWNNDCGGLDLSVVWQMVYCIMAIMIVVVVPFMIFYYEADDENLKVDAEGNPHITDKCRCGNCSRSLCVAICSTLVTLVIATLVLVISFIFLRTTHIPYKAATVQVDSSAFKNITGSFVPPLACGSTSGCTFSDEILKMDVTFVIYLAALMSFVGWWMFIWYGGIGLIALPLDSINAWRSRPTILSQKELREARQMLQNKAAQLIKYGEKLGQEMVDWSGESHGWNARRKRRKADKKEVSQLGVLVDTLETELEEFELRNPAHYKDKYNPFTAWGRLILGILGVLISLLWFLQIILYMAIKPPVTPFMNDYFTWFDGWFPLFGTLSIGFFALYLLAAAAKGNTKFGTRFFLITVHPMKLGKTLVNAFLFNLSLIMLCTLPVVQFSTDAFSAYARLTDAEVIFGSQVKHLEFFRYFWENNVFLFIMMAIAFIALIYLLWHPSDRDHLQGLMSNIREKTSAKVSAGERGGIRSGARDWP